ncbi:MAG: hypothetical protein ACBZ72_13250 [Candidatus Bathyarchaeia archaeon]|jgi:hypothetical protein
MSKKAFIAAVFAVLLIVIGGIFGYYLVGEPPFSPQISPSPQPTGQTTQNHSPTQTPPIPTTTQPSLSTPPSTTPQPTPSIQDGAVSMTYYEESRENIGNDTRIEISINATNISASPLTLNYNSFYMDIITLIDIDHPDAAAKYYCGFTGEAVPLENGTISANESNANVSFMLTFEFSTLQTFGEWASVVGTNPDTEYPFSSYHLHYGNSSPIPPFSSSKEFSSDMDSLQRNTTPWPFKLIRTQLTVETIDSGIAYTNQGNFAIFSSFSDFQEWIRLWGIPTNTDTVYYWLSDPSGSQFAFWAYIPHGPSSSQGVIFGNIFS